MNRGPTTFFRAAWLAWVLLLGGCAAELRALPQDALAFGLLGDVPYSEREIRRLDAVIADMNAQALAFVVHVGDVGTSAQACTDAWLQARKRQFARIRHPFLLLPGDNEWSDCAALGLDALERLEKWRTLFCATTLGKLKLEVQPGPYCEHVRWESAGYVFVALNVPGNNNNVRDPEHRARMEHVHAWLAEAARAAARQRGLVVLMQANPFVTVPVDGYRTLRGQLQALGEARPGKVFLVHGDTHIYKQDEPLPGLLRVEVWGSPFVNWLRASILEGELAFEQAAWR
jgi:hypothetical protein